MNVDTFHFLGEKMRHREVKELAMGHTAWEWQSSDLNAGIWLQSSLAYPLNQEVPVTLHFFGGGQLGVLPVAASLIQITM